MINIAKGKCKRVKGKGAEEDYLNSPLPYIYHLPFTFCPLPFYILVKLFRYDPKEIMVNGCKIHFITFEDFEKFVIMA